MLTDAHCHPFDLAECFSRAEDERRRQGVMCAASATTMDEFVYCEQLSQAARKNGAAPLLPCFAIHPQMPAVTQLPISNEQLTMAEMLAAQGRLAAVGETGWDLFNTAFRETEKIQEALFAAHLETAIRYDLPLVIHARRAMHKVFAVSALLKKCRSVIFHSWPGTAGEGESLLRRGVNAFFSFGSGIMCNHREAMRCCALFPPERLLMESDAPFQPLRGSAFSTYADLPRIAKAAAALRQENGEWESVIERNFRAAFGV